MLNCTRFLLISALFCLSVIYAPISHADSSVHGIMMVVKGDIVVTDKAGKSEKGKVGKKVFPGDSITSGKDSRAKIVMSDKNVLNISPESKFTIEQYVNDAKTGEKQVSLNVDYGKIRANVEQQYDGEKNKFHIKTPSAVAGVRGTDFLTSFNRATKESSVVTFGGLVAVGQAGPKGEILNPVFVRPGESTSVNLGKPPEPPRAVSPEQMKQMNTDTQADLGGGPQNGNQARNEDSSQGDNKQNEGDRGPANADGSPNPPPQDAPPVSMLPPPGGEAGGGLPLFPEGPRPNTGPGCMPFCAGQVIPQLPLPPPPTRIEGGPAKVKIIINK